MDAACVAGAPKRPEPALCQQQADAVHRNVGVAAEENAKARRVEAACCGHLPKRRVRAQPQEICVLLLVHGACGSAQTVERVEEEEQTADQQRFAAAEHALHQQQRRGGTVGLEELENAVNHGTLWRVELEAREQPGLGGREHGGREGRGEGDGRACCDERGGERKRRECGEKGKEFHFHVDLE